MGIPNRGWGITILSHRAENFVGYAFLFSSFLKKCSNQIVSVNAKLENFERQQQRKGHEKMLISKPKKVQFQNIVFA